MTLTFPVAVLDFEASSLRSTSFPIEVGVAIAADAFSPIQSWSTHIQPHASWDLERDWDLRSEGVHGIPRSALASGMSPADTMTELNKLLGPIGHAWCDGGPYDQHWFQALRRAAPLVKADFKLWDISGLFALDRRAHNRFADALARSTPPHRAGEDAVRICDAIIQANVSSHGVNNDRN